MLIPTYLVTFTGRRVNPFDPDPAQIVIEDIAHALGNLCRFNGHCADFYSVAQHSVGVSNLCSSLLDRRQALLHDASEAYLGDVPRPLKRMPEYEFYLGVEDQLRRIINAKFGLPGVESQTVIDADNNLLLTEITQLLSGVPLSHPALSGYKNLHIPIVCISPGQAKALFLDEFKRLFT